MKTGKKYWAMFTRFNKPACKKSAGMVSLVLLYRKGKNLTIKCHKDLYHVTVLTYSIKTCLTIPRKIKQEEEMLTKR